jgi:hypothetical protein
LVILDEAGEAPLGIGRSWPHAPVGDGEAVAVDALLRNFGIVSGAGQRLALSLPLDRFAATGGQDAGAISGCIIIGAIVLLFAILTMFAALTTVFISTIVRRLSQASGSSNPSAIRVNTSAFFPNGTVPPFFPPYVDLPIPQALLASQFGALIQESVATLFQGSFAVDVDILYVQRAPAFKFQRAHRFYGFNNTPIFECHRMPLILLFAGTMCRPPMADGLPYWAASSS